MLNQNQILKTVQTISTRSPIVEVLTNQEKKLVKIKGILTSQIRTKPSSDTPYYAFFRLAQECVDCHNTQEVCQALTPKHKNCEECAEQKCQDCEIPVIFRLSSEYLITTYGLVKLPLQKGTKVILTGYWAKSDQSSRPSFTCFSYKVISHE